MMELCIPQNLFIILDNLVSNTIFIELSLKILGNLLCGEDKIIDQLLSYDIIKVLAMHLNHELPQVRRKIMWCFSNIAGGNPNHINHFINSEIFKQIFEFVKDPSNAIVLETIVTCYNLLSDCELDICQKLVEMGAIDAIAFLIDNNLNPEILHMTLLSLKKIFSYGESFKQINGQENPFVKYLMDSGATDSLEKLQVHENQEVYNNALDILERYFNVE
jgi:hypothetical protein